MIKFLYRKDAQQREWALLNDHGRPVKWFGIEPPSSHDVSKAERLNGYRRKRH